MIGRCLSFFIDTGTSANILHDFRRLSKRLPVSWPTVSHADVDVFYYSFIHLFFAVNNFFFYETDYPFVTNKWTVVNDVL